MHLIDDLQGKVPFVSAEGIHQLHIFIFVLAVFHVLNCILTMALGRAKVIKRVHMVIINVQYTYVCMYIYTMHYKLDFPWILEVILIRV